MALNHLTTAEMASISKPWVTGDHVEQQALLENPASAGLVGEIELIHQQLLDTHQVISAQYEELKDELNDRDLAFDTLARGLWFGLQSAVSLAQSPPSDPERLAALEDLVNQIFPEKLLIVNRSYREEAGQAELLASRLTAEDEALLAEIPLVGGTALDIVREWLAVGARLGALEDERTLLKRATVSAGDARRARNRWIRMVSTLRDVLELTGRESPAIVAVLERVYEVERQADRRAASTGEARADDGDGGDGASDGDAGGSDGLPDAGLPNEGADDDGADGEGAAVAGDAAAITAPLGPIVAAAREDDGTAASRSAGVPLEAAPADAVRPRQ